MAQILDTLSNPSDYIIPEKPKTEYIKFGPKEFPVVQSLGNSLEDAAIQKAKSLGMKTVKLPRNVDPFSFLKRWIRYRPGTRIMISQPNVTSHGFPNMRNPDFLYTTPEGTMVVVECKSQKVVGTAIDKCFRSAIDLGDFKRPATYSVMLYESPTGRFNDVKETLDSLMKAKNTNSRGFVEFNKYDWN